VRRRFREAWAAFGTEVAEEGGRLVARWRYAFRAFFRFSILADPADGVKMLV
jgi:hypothetical protein